MNSNRSSTVPGGFISKQSSGTNGASSAEPIKRTGQSGGMGDFLNEMAAMMNLCIVRRRSIPILIINVLARVSICLFCNPRKPMAVVLLKRVATEVKTLMGAVLIRSVSFFLSFAGSSYAKCIGLDKIGIEAKQPNSAIRKCARDEVLISGFGHKGHAVGDILGVRFKVVKVSGVSFWVLFKEKKEKPRS
ncbi:hypothetical protein Bca52824_027127 [Brassica carinata]|uniref:S12 n=1 Tax=Brassica carinata TaxID=52824 RepID=A0A8X7V9F9_BRACI|nr:hypothetical protein Bca52824_027127 [Brassica carinata]